MEAGDVLEHDRSGGRTGASGLNHGEGIHGVGSRVRDRSSAAAEWVSAPIEMNSTPVVATSRRFSSVMPPLASSVGPSVDVRHDLAQPLGRHVVEQQSRRAPAASASSTSASVAGLDLEREPGRRRPRAAHGLPHPAGRRGVVLLDQDRVVEPGAVVDSTARAHRGLLQRAQAGRGLARVEDLGARALDLPNGPGGRGRNAGESLEEVQRRALGAQQRPRAALQAKDGAAPRAIPLPGRAARSRRRGRAGETPPRPRRGRRGRRAPSA